MARGSTGRCLDGARSGARAGALGTVLVAAVAMIFAAPAIAKNDIRGVATAQPLADALETLELDGAKCETTPQTSPAVCTYDARTSMALYFGRAAPNSVEKIVYTFVFQDLKAMRAKLQQLYGLRRDRIEGDHKLFSGERLIVELGPRGVGTLTIDNAAQARKDRLSEAR